MSTSRETPCIRANSDHSPGRMPMVPVYNPFRKYRDNFPHVWRLLNYLPMHGDFWITLYTIHTHPLLEFCLLTKITISYMPKLSRFLLCLCLKTEKVILQSIFLRNFYVNQVTDKYIWSALIIIKQKHRVLSARLCNVLNVLAALQRNENGSH